MHWNQAKEKGLNNLKPFTIVVFPQRLELWAR